MKTKLLEIKKIDDLLFKEMSEVSDFESELFGLEYELEEEEKLIAKLHNSCHVTVLAIRHLHTLIRRKEQDASDKVVPVLKDLVKRHIENIENDIREIGPRIEKIRKDEKAGEKIVKYCTKVEHIILKKLIQLKKRYSDV